MRRRGGFVEHLEDLLAPLGPVTSRRMFGGWGFYLGDLFFAIADDEQVWLKVDDETREAFLAAGSEPFVYVRSASGARGARREVSLSYYSAPAAALDAPEDMLPWARRAVEAARRARERKQAPRAKGAPRGSGRAKKPRRGGRAPRGAPPRRSR
jgi:DNA transformation protein and related proteins